MRWKCAKADKEFKCGGYAVTDGNAPGSLVIRFGDHEQHCEPCASTKDVATIRRAIITTASGTVGVPLCEHSPNV